MQYSIIIPTCNTHIFSTECLDSVIKYTNIDQAEIILVINDENIEDHSNVKLIKVVKFNQRIGFPKAVNAGLREARGDKIVLLNDDVVLLDQKVNHWLELLEQPFKTDIDVGITGPAKFTWNLGGISRTAIGFWCCMFDRRLIHEIGYLDEVFSPGMGEDGDYSIKCDLLGYKLVQVPVNESREFGSGISNQFFPIFHKGNGTFGV